MPAATTNASASTSTLTAELALLRKARSALAAGSAREALNAVIAHAHRFPDGRLAEERDALRVQTLTALGDLAEARAMFTRFSADYPQSAFLHGLSERIDRAADTVTP